MAKKAYIGVSSKARRSKKIYIGVGGKARKVKKGYIGVNGKARLFYQSVRNIRYVTPTIEDLQYGCYNETKHLCGASTKDYAIFLNGGGTYFSNLVDAYNSNLVKTVAPNLTKNIGMGAVASFNGIVAMIPGNYNYSSYSEYNSSVLWFRYNNSLVLSSSVYGYTYYYPAMCSNGTYLVIAGGRNEANGSYTKNVRVINSSYTLSTATDLDYTGYGYCSARVGNNVIFCAGNGTTQAGSQVRSYNNNLTLINCTSLPASNPRGGGASLSDTYAFFAPHSSYGPVYYNTSLTQTIGQMIYPNPMAYQAYGSIDDYVICFGGQFYTAQSTSGGSKAVLAWNSSLVRQQLSELNEYTYHTSFGAIAGDYLLFPGGSHGNSSYLTKGFYVFQAYD